MCLLTCHRQSVIHHDVKYTCTDLSLDISEAVNVFTLWALKSQRAWFPPVVYFRFLTSKYLQIALANCPSQFVSLPHRVILCMLLVVTHVMSFKYLPQTLGYYLKHSNFLAVMM